MEKELRIPLEIKNAMKEVMRLCKEQNIPLREVFKWANSKEEGDFEKKAEEYVDSFDESCVTHSINRAICVNALCLFKEKKYESEDEFLSDLKIRVNTQYKGFFDTYELRKVICELIYVSEVGKGARKPSWFRRDWKSVKKFLEDKVEEL